MNLRPLGYEPQGSGENPSSTSADSRKLSSDRDFSKVATVPAVSSISTIRALSLADRHPHGHQNSLHTIHPYRSGAALVFDDPAVGLQREALVGGTDLILELAARVAGVTPERFTLIFAEGPFPGHQASATWIEKGEAGFGDWYLVTLPGHGIHHGWLCPALLKYFPAAPSRIFFSVHPHERKS